MKKNMGQTDKMIRIVLAIVLALLNYFEVVSGTFGIVLLVLAIVFLATSFLNFCPLYTLIGFSTAPKDENAS